MRRLISCKASETAKFRPRNLKVIGCLQAGSSKDEVTITGEDGKKYELTVGRMLCPMLCPVRREHTTLGRRYVKLKNEWGDMSHATRGAHGRY